MTTIVSAMRDLVYTVKNRKALMISRRGFLTQTGGIAAASVASCHVTGCTRSDHSRSVAPSDAVGIDYVDKREAFLKDTDQLQFIGYPGNRSTVPEGLLAWREDLRKLEFGVRSTNNIGDPFRRPAAWNSHPLEADLIKRFGVRFGFDPANIWGFVSNSGTDSNLHGAYIGRTLLRARTGILPKFYYTLDAHYSIQIVCDVLGLDGVVVASTDDGRMDATDLARKLTEAGAQPALVMATVGTTFKGAIDPLDDIQRALQGRASYVHVDAALFGGYLHATEYAPGIYQQQDGSRRYDSIAVSCHKFFGYPATAGLFVMEQHTFEAFRNEFARVHDPAYISHVPGTISCSRDATKPAEFHYYVTEPALQRQHLDAAACLDNAAWLHQQLRERFPLLDARRFDSRSNIVYFENRLSEQVVNDWVLATLAPNESRPALAHVVVMPHVTRPLLERFLDDVAKA